jgi:hypothetical protein
MQEATTAKGQNLTPTPDLPTPHPQKQNRFRPARRRRNPAI